MILLVLFAAAYLLVLATVFFDQARLTRKNTLYKLTGTPRRIALTFDDGPSPEWTPRILDVLKRHGVTATFFLVGRNVKKYPDIARAIVEAGHEVGNHTFNHQTLLSASRETVTAEIRDTEKEIEAACGRRPRLFRPPKGLIWPRQKAWIKECGYDVVMWSVNAKDWAGFSWKRLVSSLKRRSGEGDIVLFHDGGGVFASGKGNRSATIEALDTLIPHFKERNLNIVSLKTAGIR